MNEYKVIAFYEDRDDYNRTFPTYDEAMRRAESLWDSAADPWQVSVTWKESIVWHRSELPDNTPEYYVGA